MSKLFIYDRTKELFCEGLGFSLEEFQGLHKKLYDMIIDDVKNTSIQEDENSITMNLSKAEYAQGLAEYLNRDLTPELGLGIGLILSDMDVIVDKIMEHNGLSRGEESN